MKKDIIRLCILSFFLLLVSTIIVLLFGKTYSFNIELDSSKNYDFYKYLYNDLPPVDLMIRTSGEIRISNFMLYSISYAELYFTKTCFPDFDEGEFDKALEDYQNRNITKGVVK